MVEVLAKGDILPPYMYGTGKAIRQIVEVLVTGGDALPPYTYGTLKISRQIMEVLCPQAYYNLGAYNNIEFGQIVSPLVASSAVQLIKPLVSKADTVQTIPNVDTVNHGDFPTWSDNGSHWEQTRRAINIRAESNAACFNQTTSQFGDTGAGTAKWVGGVLAPNGCIYGIPHSSNTILKIDPTTDTITTFGDVGADTYKWYGGVLAPNGCIYGIPFNIGTVLKIDPVTDTFTTFASAAYGYAGGAVAENGAIYCVPWKTNTTILKIDPETDTTTEFGSLAADSDKWRGGILAPNGFIYGIPDTSTSVLKIDPTTDTVTTFGSLSGSFKWFSGVIASNGIIYGLPASSTSALRIDPATDTAVIFNGLPGSSGRCGCGSLSPNGMIYCPPWDTTAQTVLKIDPTADTMTQFDSLGSDDNKWFGAVLAPNGAIYCIPYSVSAVLKIGTELDDVPLDFCLSRYFNNY